MFADDTSISYASDSTEELQNVINTELKGLNDWFTTNKLSLSIVKTEFMIVGSRQRIKTLNNEIDIEINGNMVNQVTLVKSLGVHFDNHLMWSEHTDKLCKKNCFSHRGFKTYKILHFNEHGYPSIPSTDSTAF